MALILSIIAVVLGALGLVGGVIGYVQGTAALRRATITRQRAASAEEAALQARAQAEQSARVAQDALDRLGRLQVRSLGDVADLPTGPLILPPRVAPIAASPPFTAPPVIAPTAPRALSDSSGLDSTWSAAIPFPSVIPESTERDQQTADVATAAATDGDAGPDDGSTPETPESEGAEATPGAGEESGAAAPGTDDRERDAAPADESAAEMPPADPADAAQPATARDAAASGLDRADADSDEPHFDDSTAELLAPGEPTPEEPADDAAEADAIGDMSEPTADVPPADVPPSDEATADVLPAGDATSDVSPADEATADVSPADDAPADEAADDAPEDDATADEAAPIEAGDDERAPVAPDPTGPVAEASSGDPDAADSAAVAPTGGVSDSSNLAVDAVESTAGEPSPPTEPDPEAPVSALRSDTARVTAVGGEAPPMDWAEALRTGAIPLPSRSRGTYAAPDENAKPPRRGPARFELRAVSRQQFEAVNMGAEAAPNAIVEGVGDDRHLIHPLDARPVTVLPGRSLVFSVLRVDGRHVSVHISWDRDGERAETELRLS